MKNWFEIAAGVYLVGMVLYGHYRGAIRMAVSMVALIATFLIVHAIMPTAAVFVKNETPVYGWIEDSLKENLFSKADEEILSGESAVMESFNLPPEILELLLENDSNSMHNVPGVEIFIEYVSDYVAGMLVNGVGFVILFLAIYSIVHIIMRCLDLMAKLPVVSGINKLAGALLGGIQGLFFLWLLLLVVTAFSQSGWAGTVIGQIESSKWLAFLYHHNFLSKIVLNLVKGMLG